MYYFGPTKDNYSALELTRTQSGSLDRVGAITVDRDQGIRSV